MKPGLGRMQLLMEKLGNPERRLKFIHVAGTNGKGSTCAYLASVLQACGYDVGMFTSPYIGKVYQPYSSEWAGHSRMTCCSD